MTTFYNARIARHRTAVVLELHLQGPREAVRQALQQYQNEGRLMEFTQPQSVPGSLKDVCVTVMLRPASRSRSYRSRYLVAAMVLAVMAVMALVAWMVMTALAWMAAHAALIVGLLVGLAALGVVAGGACKTVVTIKHWH